MTASKRSQQLKARFDRHIRDTYPCTSNDYMGKEHFWVLGDEIGVRRKATGMLFGQVCFPVRGNPWLLDTDEIEVVNPKDLGLKLASRADMGMKKPPVPLNTIPPAKSLIARGITTATEANNLITDTLVQIEGLTELAVKANETAELELTDESRQALAKLAVRLVQFP